MFVLAPQPHKWTGCQLVVSKRRTWPVLSGTSQTRRRPEPNILLSDSLIEAFQGPIDITCTCKLVSETWPSRHIQLIRVMVDLMLTSSNVFHIHVLLPHRLQCQQEKKKKSNGETQWMRHDIVLLERKSQNCKLKSALAHCLATGNSTMKKPPYKQKVTKNQIQTIALGTVHNRRRFHLLQT